MPDLEVPKRIVRAGHFALDLPFLKGGVEPLEGAEGCRWRPTILEVKELQLMDDGIHLPKQFPAADLGGVSRLHGGQI